MPCAGLARPLERADIGPEHLDVPRAALHSGDALRDFLTRNPPQCAEENAIVRKRQRRCVEDTGGMFVLTPTTPDFARFLPAT